MLTPSLQTLQWPNCNFTAQHLVQYREPLIALRLEHLGVHHENCHELCPFHLAIVLTNSMVTTWQLDKTLARMVDFWWVAIHAAEDLTLLDHSNDGSAAMAMGRRESIGRVFKLNPNNGFPGRIGELVVEDNAETFSGTGTTGVSEG